MRSRQWLATRRRVRRAEQSCCRRFPSSSLSHVRSPTELDSYRRSGVAGDPRARCARPTHHPLLGTASSAALNRADVVPTEPPGPVDVRCAGASGAERSAVVPGLAIGVGMVNLAARSDRNHCSPSAAAATRVVRSQRSRFAGLGWAAGSESLYDPYNPTAAMLPTLACLFLAWCAVDLDTTALVWSIGVALVRGAAQQQLPVVPHTAACVARLPSMCTDAPPTTGSSCARSQWRAGAVFLVLWSQPLIEQLLHGRDGNIARMIRASNVLVDNTGTRLGTQIAAATLTLPPWWGRSEFDGVRLFSPIPHVLGRGRSRRSYDRVRCVCSWMEMGAAASTPRRAGCIDCRRLSAPPLHGWRASDRPMSSFFGISSDYVRWLWPASVFLWFAIGLTIWRLIASCAPVVAGASWALIDRPARQSQSICLANLPSHASLREATRARPTTAVAIEVVDEASDRVDVDAVLYRPPRSTTCSVCHCSLGSQSEGVEFLVDDPVLVRQFGERRRYRRRRWRVATS